MKYLMMILVLILMLSLDAQAKSEFDFNRRDLQIHLAVSFGSSLLISKIHHLIAHKDQNTLFHNAWVGFLSTVVLGFMKEIIIDSFIKTQSIDGNDIAANVLGAGLGSMVYITLNW